MKKFQLVKRLSLGMLISGNCILLTACDSSSDSSVANSTNATCTILNIYDGDTMTLKCKGNADKIKVRMYCIDTPEIKQQPWGEKARDYLRGIAGEQVHLEAIDKDRYGRVVGEVYSGERNLNLEQVKAGQAAVYEDYCKKPEYKQVEATAKTAKLGIWAKAGLHQTPWEWRKKERED